MAKEKEMLRLIRWLHLPARPTTEPAAEKERSEWNDVLDHLCPFPSSQGLAKSIAWDGEGATCLMEISVVGAKSDEDARKVWKPWCGGWRDGCARRRIH